MDNAKMPMSTATLNIADGGYDDDNNNEHDIGIDNNI
jgi:hypothetical protein